jgi:autotransporter-associated beta strand protein
MFGGTDTLEFTDSLNLGGNRTFTVENTTTLDGVISGNNDSLIKNGRGTLILNGNNTFAGTSRRLTVNERAVPATAGRFCR